MPKPSPYPKDLRLKWYRLVDADHRSVREACQTFGIPKKTFYKWRRRDFGLADPRYRSRRPHPGLKLTHEVRQLIETEKLRTNYGPRKMAVWLWRRHGLKASPTIIYRFYRKRGLIRSPQRRLPWYQPLTERIIPTGPGELVEADLKYVWVDGRRQYQITFTDVFTGWPTATIRPRKTDDDAIAAFAEAKKQYPFPIQCVQTDNGGEFRGDFHRHLEALGIRHVFIPKSSPWWSGHVERLHGVMDQEFWLNPKRAFQTLPDYLVFYTTDRIHLGKYLNGLTPLEKFQQYLQPSPLNVN